MYKRSNNLENLISNHRIMEINHWISKYPKGKQQSAVMRTLMIVQEEHGYLNETLISAIADYLNMPAISVYEIATFYSMYELKPVGKYIINICSSISCMLLESNNIINYIKKKLNVEIGSTTIDNRFTVKLASCLGACIHAPVMRINKKYYENLSIQNIDSILDKYI